VLAWGLVGSSCRQIVLAANQRFCDEQIRWRAGAAHQALGKGGRDLHSMQGMRYSTLHSSA
jgi:hypothetical protein